MLCDHGGLETAQLLLHSNHVSEGYTALWERGKLNLTWKPRLATEWHDLFTDEEREIASKRLKEYGYTHNGPVEANRENH